jgi:hypothetical protein
MKETLMIHCVRVGRKSLAALTLVLALLALPRAAHAICTSTEDCPYPKECINNFCKLPTEATCSSACTTSTACSTTCMNGGVQQTCGQYGVCIPTCTTDTCGSCAAPASGVDTDADGIPDRLEYDLAYKYFPTIWLQHYDTDLSESYVYSGKAIPFMVRPYGPSGSVCNEALKCLEIRYGTAYFNDRGDPTFGLGHFGDSEMYAALVVRTTLWPVASSDPTSWQMIRDFTAAHWRDTADSSRVGEYSYCPPQCSAWSNDETACRNNGRCIYFPGFCTGGVDAQQMSCSSYSDNASCYFAGGSCHWLASSCGSPSSVTCYSTSPRTTYWTAYAAEGKHGLYHTDAECDGGGICVPGAGCSDECPTNSFNMRDYISGKLQNAGNSSASTALDLFMQDPDKCRLYGIWSGNNFGDASSYSSHFLYPISWDLP